MKIMIPDPTWTPPCTCTSCGGHDYTGEGVTRPMIEVEEENHESS
jgi:hypothetical protein